MAPTSRPRQALPAIAWETTMAAELEHELAKWLANQPKSTEVLLATWCSPEWADLVEKFDEAVEQARKATGIERSPATVKS